MSVGSILDTAVSGLNAASAKAEAAASNIANHNSDGYSPHSAPVSTAAVPDFRGSNGGNAPVHVQEKAQADLTAEVLALKMASQSYKAAATLVAVASDMSAAIVGIKA